MEEILNNHAFLIYELSKRSPDKDYISVRSGELGMMWEAMGDVSRLGNASKCEEIKSILGNVFKIDKLSDSLKIRFNYLHDISYIHVDGRPCIVGNRLF